MSDRRLTPANARVAAAHLDSVDPGLTRVQGQPRQIIVSLVDLLRAPDGPRDRQLLFGDPVTVYENRNGWSFVQADKDGYVGYLPSSALGPITVPTHWVAAPASHVYRDAHIKSPDLFALSLGARIAAQAEHRDFIETAEGFIPRTHLREIEDDATDPVAVAKTLLHTPYLWGGNSRWGIDCSGLVQAALLACALPCPGDSDLQQTLGQEADGAPRRGDLLFWKGHVGLIAGPDRLLHANAYHMAVVQESLKDAIQRIAAQDGGGVTAHRRL
ncbi:C40 family peptidase [Pontibaca salina]|uniref:C40 family peptidase n=1 Tax=Pontibaca salina TaxID=2795731 RepID=A0A934HP79_9RHOB|nr:NlpC/P60 family protein [Pontibaca salina]MBI6628446.1 C40 family peptidase [Pontibaca salina]